MIHIWEKYVKRRNEQSRYCGCNLMTLITLLILLNVFLMIFAALLGLSGWGGQNWFNKESWETRAIRNPTATGPAAQKNLKNGQPSLEQNGIDFDLNDPKRRNGVIYL
jgi:hypothetical protein